MTLLRNLEQSVRRSHDRSTESIVLYGGPARQNSVVQWQNEQSPIHWSFSAPVGDLVPRPITEDTWVDVPSDAIIEGIEVRLTNMPAMPAIPPQPELDPNFLRDMCDRQDRIPEVSRFSEDHGYVHVSSLSDLCARQYAIARQFNVELQTSPTGANRIVWEIGNALEDHVLRNVERSHGHDRVLRNVQLTDEEYRIVGRPDSIVEVGGGVGLVVETKTMNIREWEQLEEPRQEHVFQAAMYRWMMERRFPGEIYGFGHGGGLVRWTSLYPHDHVVIFYIAKDFTRGSPYKEFHVNVNDGPTPRNIELALEAALELRQSMEREGLPRRTACTRINCRRAQECGVAHLCFNLPTEST